MSLPTLALSLEEALFAAIVAAAILVLLVGHRSARGWALCFAFVLTAFGVGGTVVWSRETTRRIESNRQMSNSVPHQGRPNEGYVSSDACRACHPAQYQSWHDSFHRTMTQVATPDAVLGPFNDVRLSSRGRTYQLRRDEDEFWVNMVDPVWEHELQAQGINPASVSDGPRVDKRVVMTTGSHHQQTYWVYGDEGRQLLNVPFMWMIKEQQWVPREDVFLRSPTFGRSMDRWNENCVECHATGGILERGPLKHLKDTRVAELGIACEACHGPAEDHIRANRNPRRRLRMHLGENPDPTIVNPARLPARKQNEICGQCHGMNLFRAEPLKNEIRYTAGGDFYETRYILRGTDRNLTAADMKDWQRQQRHLDKQAALFMKNRYWPDGMVRVSGREHNALIESACHAGGELSCLTCHSMHESDPNDQLAAGMSANQACFQCHEEYRADLENHTNHPPDSSGSRCYNCHMPHTTYGLLKAIRSHWIDSPSVESTLETGRPNACNLCHLDRSLGWTSEHLAEWYGRPGPELSDNDRTIAASVLSCLTGDANQRALAAWHMGWGPAKDVSGREWQAPYLAHLLNDPYSAVRFIAYRSLRRLPGFETLRYDFVGKPEARRNASARMLSIWRALTARDRVSPKRDRLTVLIGSNGQLDIATVARLSQQRNDRTVDLRE